jgi:glycosyltransferase involved in cell wall biosynthesis
MKVCQALVEIGHELNVWLPDYGGVSNWDALRQQYGLRGRFTIRRLRALPGLGRYEFCLRAVLQARRWSADLFYMWPIQAAAMAAWSRLPSVLEVHDLPRGRLGPRLLGGYLRSHAPHRVLPISHALQRRLASDYALSLEPPLSVVSPDGIDFERYEELPSPRQARSRLSLPDSFTAVYTGHLYGGRGLELILELARRNPAMSFVIAGGEPGAVERWRDRAGGSGLQNVHFLGFIPNADLPLIQAAGDILLMPYARSIAVSGGGDTSAFASPMKMFEYLAAERVVFSSDLPVLREVLNDENAVLLPPEDPEAWQSALDQVRRDPARMAALAARARQDVQKYTWVERARRSLEGL